MIAKNKVQKEAEKRILNNYEKFRKTVSSVEIDDPITGISHNEYYLVKGFNIKFHLVGCKNLNEAYKRYKEKSFVYDRAINGKELDKILN